MTEVGKIRKLMTLITSSDIDCWYVNKGLAYLRIGHYVMIRVGKDGGLQIAGVSKYSSASHDEVVFDERGLLVPLNQKQKLSLSKLAIKIRNHDADVIRTGERMELDRLLKRALEQDVDTDCIADHPPGPGKVCHSCGGPDPLSNHGDCCAACVSKAYNPR